MLRFYIILVINCGLKMQVDTNEKQALKDYLQLKDTDKKLVQKIIKVLVIHSLRKQLTHEQPFLNDHPSQNSR